MPPRPEAIIEGVAKAVPKLESLKQQKKAVRRTHDFPVKGLNAETGREPEELLARIRELFGERALSSMCAPIPQGKEAQYRDIWPSVEKGRSAVTDVPRHVRKRRRVVTLNYHFGIFQCAGWQTLRRGRERGASEERPCHSSLFPVFRVSTEREMREMLGITFDGLPNTALVFPEDWDRP